MIYNQDCLDGLKNLGDCSFDLICTSPPYKDKNGYYPVLLQDVFRELYRTLKDNCLFFLNFGHLSEDKFRPFRSCNQAMSEGFKLNETIYLAKKSFLSYSGQ